MSGESSQPQAGPSHAGEDQESRERDQVGVPGGVIRRAVAQGPRSWIQKVLERVIDTPRQRFYVSEVVPVAVLAVQRYLLEDEPRDLVPKLPLYCYDVTISDGVYQEKCYLNPSLNFLVYKNILKVGKEVRISRVSCLYNEKRIGQGVLCIDNVHCGKILDAISLETPFRNHAHEQVPERPLRGGKSHYLALWNNEDPYGDIWLTNKEAEELSVKNSKIISLSHLEMTWSNRRNFPALLVRILYKSKLRYYGKPDRRIVEPFQIFLEVADSSGIVSVIMWNALCPEWYKCLQVGVVLLLQQYSVKKCYQFRMHPHPLDPQMKIISTMEICLNLQDPPTNISIISEKQVKTEWKLPKLNNQFVTRSELDDLPENQLCDVVGVLVFVGRVQRLKKKESREEFLTYRWIHIADGTSELPFIVELFSTSQPEVFENINPMTYFSCTQLKVVRDDDRLPKLLYLTTTNESQMLIIGHEGQPYTYEAKVKNFIQWIKTKTDSGEMKNTVFGGYYPYPPVPETFTKYSISVKVESLLTAISEAKKEIEDLQYREQKRIAIQGIITVIKYIPHSGASESASASDTLRNANLPSTSQAARGESQKSQERDGKRRHDDSEPGSSQTASARLIPSNKKRVLEGPNAKPSYNGRESISPHLIGKARKTLNHKWESQLWRERKFGLLDHLHYSHVYPESIPRRFNSEYSTFLTQQYNTQPSKYIPPEEGSPKLEDIKSACSIGHFELTILGLNHDIAIDVAFLPMYCPKDVRTSQIDTLLTCLNYNCVFPPEATDHDRFPGPRALAGDIMKAVTELNRVHIVGILDICNLGDNKIEVFLHKIYTPETIS
ncbi:RPA-related protein RADX [Orycteropus afer afer]|uniref:RPA-related protein RADX n=1 Tax=Orycteropus afer afer TaxID=1230840 RepID=A0AC54ZA37_ORYAF|nr:RPA-related protein RADX [Orycteropus afer afer]